MPPLGAGKRPSWLVMHRGQEAVEIPRWTAANAVAASSSFSCDIAYSRSPSLKKGLMSSQSSI